MLTMSRCLRPSSRSATLHTLPLFLHSVTSVQLQWNEWDDMGPGVFPLSSFFLTLSHLVYILGEHRSHMGLHREHMWPLTCWGVISCVPFKSDVGTFLLDISSFRPLNVSSSEVCKMTTKQKSMLAFVLQVCNYSWRWVFAPISLFTVLIPLESVKENGCIVWMINSELKENNLRNKLKNWRK